MQVTLTNGKLYRLSFKHDYAYDYQVTGNDIEFDSDTKKITETITWEIVSKTPVATTAYLWEIYRDNDPKVHGLRVYDDPTYFGHTDKHPNDQANKEMARQKALGRLLDQVEKSEDKALIWQCYINRKLYNTAKASV